MNRYPRLIIEIVAIAATAALWRDAAHAQHGTNDLTLASTILAVSSGPRQQPPPPRPIEIPSGVTSLEGIPSVRIDATAAAATRQVLDAAEAAKARLTVKVVDGQFYWATRGNRLLRLDPSGPFTYLSSEPGQYIRLTRLDDKISYAEHVDLSSSSVTWFGELRVVVGK